jgi:hypothetical protein
MYKYLIINPAIATRSPISQTIIYCHNAILGTITAKSRAVATAKAIELTGISRPIVTIYLSLSDDELEMANLAKILWEQPNGNPKTDTNPRGAGRRSKYDQTIRINLDVGLSEDDACWWRSLSNKTAMLRELIKNR